MGEVDPVRLVVSGATVPIPTYNEAENLAWLTPELLALPGGVSVIVVDQASPDGTGQLADSLAHDFPERVVAVHRAAKLGLGPANLAGFRGVQWECLP
jgi:dolichol-phosphate mannosyltransferase